MYFKVLAIFFSNIDTQILPAKNTYFVLYIEFMLIQRADYENETRTEYIF